MPSSIARPVPQPAHDADQVRIEVANPGQPIPPDVLRHLFDRFYRAEPSRTNSRENHGLGLAIVKAIAEMHGGTVWAHSAGGLNTFGFSVSRGPAAPAEPLGSGPASPSVGGSSDALPTVVARVR
jgi:two-component system heavy metal sensor histidine kinase CusS